MEKFDPLISPALLVLRQGHGLTFSDAAISREIGYAGGHGPQDLDRFERGRSKDMKNRRRLFWMFYLEQTRRRYGWDGTKLDFTRGFRQINAAELADYDFATSVIAGPRACPVCLYPTADYHDVAHHLRTAHVRDEAEAHDHEPPAAAVESVPEDEDAVEVEDSEGTESSSDVTELSACSAEDDTASDAEEAERAAAEAAAAAEKVAAAILAAERAAEATTAAGVDTVNPNPTDEGCVAVNASAPVVKQEAPGPDAVVEPAAKTATRGEVVSVESVVVVRVDGIPTYISTLRPSQGLAQLIQLTAAGDLDCSGTRCQLTHVHDPEACMLVHPKYRTHIHVRVGNTLERRSAGVGLVRNMGWFDAQGCGEGRWCDIAHPHDVDECHLLHAE